MLYYQNRCEFVVKAGSFSVLKIETLKDQADIADRELSDDEIKNMVNITFSFGDEIESIYFQMIEVRKNLRAAFKAEGIYEKLIMGDA